MRTAKRFKSEPAGGVQLWTIPVAVLAVMMAVSLIRSAAGTGTGDVRSRLVAPLGSTSYGQQVSNGEGGGLGRNGLSGPAAAGDRPAERVRD